jgi:hypothetical protein
MYPKEALTADKNLARVNHAAKCFKVFLQIISLE